MELNTSERIMMDGLLSREREIERETLSPFRADFALVTRMIESRLNLPAGSIGTTHGINMDTLTVVDNRPPAATETEEEKTSEEEETE